MTNALKHGVGPIRYAIALEDDALVAVVENAVAAGAPPVDPGMGLENVAARLRELGGAARWQRHDDRFRLELRMPWSPTS